MTKNTFSMHLVSYLPKLRKLVNLHFMKMTNQSYISAEDVMQEIAMELWLRVPDNYIKNKGMLKSYCFRAAINMIKKLKNKVARDFNVINVDWSLDFEDAKEFWPYDELINILNVDSEKNSILFKLNIADLIQLDGSYNIIHELLTCDADRSALRKKLNVSNSMISRQIREIKKKEAVCTKLYIDR